MHRVLILITFSIVIVCGLDSGNILLKTLQTSQSTTDLLNVGTSRAKGHYYLYPLYGWHALSWIYWIKVKLVVVAFFAYTAFIWALRYFDSYYNKCSDAGHGHHGYYNYGSLKAISDDLEIPKILQVTKKKLRNKRSNPLF